VKFFLSERISQDPLENFFGCQRQRGRTQENPNAQQFCKNTQALRVINSVCGNISKGNCRGRKQHVDMQDNKPLPKWRRIRKQPSKNNKDTEKENMDSLFSVTTAVSSAQTTISPSTQTSSVLTVALPPAEAAISLSTESTSVQNIISPSVYIVPSPSDHTIVLPPAKALISPTTDEASVPCSVQNVISLSVKTTIPQSNKSSIAHVTDSHSAQLDHEPTINEVLGPGKADETITKAHGIILRRQDLWTLKSHGQLNDQVSLTLLVSHHFN